MTSNNFSRSDIGGASGSQPQNVPQLDPVFSYRVSGGGDVFVYLIRTQGAKVAIATFDDGYSEEPYAVSAITNANTGISLVYSAIETVERFICFDFLG